MGDISDMMLDGTLCAFCGEYIGKQSRDCPTLCKDCEKQNVFSHKDKKERANNESPVK